MSRQQQLPLGPEPLTPEQQLERHRGPHTGRRSRFRRKTARISELQKLTPQERAQALQNLRQQTPRTKAQRIAWVRALLTLQR